MLAGCGARLRPVRSIDPAMFDIAFSELLIIAVVALVVLGPERLPKVARTAGHLLGRLQRYVNDVKADINREMQLEELESCRRRSRIRRAARNAASPRKSSRPRPAAADRAGVSARRRHWPRPRWRSESTAAEAAAPGCCRRRAASRRAAFPTTTATTEPAAGQVPVGKA